MKAWIDGRLYQLDGAPSLADLQLRYCPDSDAVILNGTQTGDLARAVQEGDRLHFVARGSAPVPDDLEARIFARQPAAVTRMLKNACVGIAGAGGLGSVVAEMLARAGVGRLVVIDCDSVEPSNLNRQRFLIAQLGTAKVQALADNIRAFNPFADVVAVQERLTFDNAGVLFQECSIVAECLDSPADKAAVVSGILKNMPRAVVVAASGLAGLGDGRDIAVRKVFSRLFLVGDTVSDAAEGAGLFAPRVGIAASHQAHLILRLIAGEEG